MGKFELVEEFGYNNQSIRLKKLETLPDCYSPIKRFFGIWRNFTLYTSICRGHSIVVYKGTKKRWLCSDVTNIEKISENLFRVTTFTSIYLIKI